MSPPLEVQACPMSPELCSVRFATLLQTVEAMKEQLNDLHVCFFGDGTQQAPGIVVRLDRLERAESNRSRLLWIVLGAVVTSLIGAIAAAVHFGGRT